MTNRIYVACLASYNNGVLHGKWIDATSCADDMQAEINEMLRASKFPNVRVAKDDESAERANDLNNRMRVMTPEQCCGSAYRAMFDEWISLTVPSAEEWAIHDHEGAALASIGENASLDEIATRVETEELAEAEFGADGPEIVRAYWDHIGGEPDDAQDAVEQARDAYCGSFDSWTDWAEFFLESTGELNQIPENLRQYFDFEAYGRDARLNGDFFENAGHFFSNH
jgi:antirestriction protein